MNLAVSDFFLIYLSVVLHFNDINRYSPQKNKQFPLLHSYQRFIPREITKSILSCANAKIFYISINMTSDF